MDHYHYICESNEAFKITAIFDLLQFGGISSSMKFGCFEALSFLLLSTLL